MSILIDFDAPLKKGAIESTTYGNEKKGLFYKH